MATVAAVALLAVLAVVVWGGGERSTGATGAPAGGDSGTPVATGEGFEGGQSGPVTERPSSEPSSDSEASPTVEAAPLEPAQIAPAALLVGDGELAGVGYEWRLPGRVDSVAQRYLDLFPQPGYEMKGGLGADHPSGQTIYVYTVTPIDDLSTAPVGSMLFMADPADPQGQTRVGLKIGR